MLTSVLPDIPEPNHSCDVVVHCCCILSQLLYCSGMVLVPFLLLFQESSMFCLRVLDVEESVIGTGEESTVLLIIVICESVGGVGVSSCIKLGRRSRSWSSVWISGVPARKRRVCPLVILALRPCLLYWLLWLRMSSPWVSKDSWIVIAIMQVRCFF